MSEYSAYVGLDVHKETIAVAVALPGRGEPVYRGEIAHRRGSLRRLMGRLSPHGEVLSFCYEAGPCGYGVYREIIEAGHDCAVVAPSLIPRKPGDRVKTDRRDALTLARLHRSGDLTAVWVPGLEQEAMRDLTRAREDMKGLQLKARQRLGAFLLRHGRVYEGKCRWTKAHSSWLEAQAFESPVQQVVFQEYVDAVTQASARVASLEGRMHGALETWSLAPAVAGLRGAAGRGHDRGDDGAGGAGRSGALRVAAPVDEFSGAGAERAFLRIAPATGRDHQDRQRARAPGAGGGGVELPVPGAPDRAPEAQGRGGAGDRSGTGLGSAEAAMRPLSASASRRQGQEPGHHGGGAGVGGVHLGDRPRGGRPPARQPGGRLSAARHGRHG